MKFLAEEFIVEEIDVYGNRLKINTTFQPANADDNEDNEDAKFVHFILQKTNWNTTDALAEIARKLHCSNKKFDFAGTKDRSSISTQMASGFAIDYQRLMALTIKDIKILGAWKQTSKIRLGQLLGNGFTITLNATNSNFDGNAQRIIDKLNKSENQIPNYFGNQRFGSLRQNSALMGKLLLKQDFQGAVENYLMYTTESEKEEFKIARNKLKDEGDYSKAMQYFPKALGFEKKLLSHLVNLPNDYAGALRKLPRTLLLLFIHAYQSNIFNQVAKIRNEKKLLNTPLKSDFIAPIGEYGFVELDKCEPVGLQIEVAKERIESKKYVLASKLIGPNQEVSDFELQFLKNDGLNIEDFQMKGMPELNCNGTIRALNFPLKDFSIKSTEKADEAVLDFIIPSGCYATVALEELMS